MFLYYIFMHTFILKLQASLCIILRNSWFLINSAKLGVGVKLVSCCTHGWSARWTCPSRRRWAAGTPAAPGGAAAPSPGRSPSGRWARPGPPTGSPAACTPAPAATGPAGPPAGCSLQRQEVWKWCWKKVNKAWEEKMERQGTHWCCGRHSRRRPRGRTPPPSPPAAHPRCSQRTSEASSACGRQRSRESDTVQNRLSCDR